MTARAIAVRYVLFAAVAIGANLATQWLMLSAVAAPPGLAVMLALAAGTVVALVVKYVLDKLYIFRDRTSGAQGHLRTFTIYAATGLITTAIFWAIELAAWLADPGGPIMYAAGAVGLAFCYALKYRLDRRFAFRHAMS